MKVAVLGGTGRMGRTLATQLGMSNEVVIGSRDPARAKAAAQKIDGATGYDYRGACESAEAAIFSLPYSAIGEARALSVVLSGKLVVSVINPISTSGGLQGYPLEEGSAAEELAKLIPDSRVTTAFNNISPLFFERGRVPEMDVLVAADSSRDYEDTARLVRGIRNLRPLYAGPLSQSRVIEMITPLMLNVAKFNGTGSLAPRFVSAKEQA